ncbi:hypothetical protein PR003_g21888 [Phytophthora rubi]|uniref:Uncharacterized protein n=1 Tax=Phytophthora rubi TaxID=129364 RepID=A0A6A3JC60_9STRA|nr:hypothetical protein PR002_g21295 [Phytophthora rubi]KAE8993926.1 hypothetical protein PR001_g20539 [Phytophthora rubi]KAE9303905.1 hypothetical protein PR003_g21888 [Phytophthora rubi]
MLVLVKMLCTSTGVLPLKSESSYQVVLANDEVNQLCGAQYVYALWGALFAAPMSVLAGSEERYDGYGRTLKKWSDAAYATFYAYLPELVLSTAHSTVRYAYASKEAGASSGRRTAEVFRVGFRAAHQYLSVLIHLPVDIYNLLELILQGKVGVVWPYMISTLLTTIWSGRDGVCQRASLW